MLIQWYCEFACQLAKRPIAYFSLTRSYINRVVFSSLYFANVIFKRSHAQMEKMRSFILFTVITLKQLIFILLYVHFATIIKVSGFFLSMINFRIFTFSFMQNGFHVGSIRIQTIYFSKRKKKIFCWKCQNGKNKLN